MLLSSTVTNDNISVLPDIEAVYSDPCGCLKALLNVIWLLVSVFITITVDNPALIIDALICVVALGGRVSVKKQPSFKKSKLAVDDTIDTGTTFSTTDPDKFRDPVKVVLFNDIIPFLATNSFGIFLVF
jgi:hypothetical protein